MSHEANCHKNFCGILSRRLRRYWDGLGCPREMIVTMWISQTPDIVSLVDAAWKHPKYSRFCILPLEFAVHIDWPAHRAGLLRCIFFVQPGSVYKFPPFLWVKLWVGWVGRGYIKISRYFPSLWINRVTLVTKINFGIHWDIRSPLKHQKCLYGMLFCVSKPDSIYAVYHSSPISFSDWLIIYPRLYRLQHSPNLVDVGL